MILSEAITKRLIDRITMDLRIASNPHLKPEDQKAFIKELQDRRRALYGVGENTAPLDKAALDMLKSQLKNSSKAITVK